MGCFLWISSVGWQFQISNHYPNLSLRLLYEPPAWHIKREFFDILLKPTSSVFPILLCNFNFGCSGLKLQQFYHISPSFTAHNYSFSKSCSYKYKIYSEWVIYFITPALTTLVWAIHLYLSPAAPTQYLRTWSLAPLHLTSHVASQWVF